MPTLKEQFWDPIAGFGVTFRTMFRKVVTEQYPFEKMPTAPRNPIVWLSAVDRPQPRLDAERDGGMTVSIGRVRPCPVLGVKFIALGHNTIRGAAGAAVLNAELMRADGLLVGD